MNSKILMIDNYDSFTYNLVQYLGELGAELVVRRNDDIDAGTIFNDLKPSAIIISPGPGRPEGAGNCLDIIDKCHTEMPILGVCLGHQAIGQCFGATIGYAPSLMHGKTSDIQHSGHALFAEVSNPFCATRYHSLVIEPGTVPEDFDIVATTEGDVIMAIAHRKLPVYGIQFHPESILTLPGKRILYNFLTLAGIKARKPSQQEIKTS